MSGQFVRVFKKLDVKAVKEHLLIYGELAGQCGHCDVVDLKLEQEKCPECGHEFKYIAFRNPKSHFPKMHKLTENRADVIMIDYDDYKRALSAAKAQDFLK